MSLKKVDDLYQGIQELHTIIQRLYAFKTRYIFLNPT